MRNYTIARLKQENLIIFEAVMGSYAYGTNLPTSDVDIRGIFIQPIDDILGFGKIDQVADETNDIIYYEIGRFLDLLRSNNPNILELLNVPEDCIKICHPIMNLIFDRKNEFITKKCRWSFGGYAVEQIKKARGLNKKMNWEENEMVRKSVLDFCYVLVENGSVPFKEWVKHAVPGATFRNFALSNIDHAHDLYAMFKRSKNELQLHPLGGIVSDEEKANDVQLTSIPKFWDNGVPRSVFAYLTFNKDGYSSHCKKYLEYQEWLKHRNVARVNMAKEHGKKYDGKNLAHCVRLLEMALEIALEQKINVRRSNREKLISIRKGEYEYDHIINEAEELIKQMDLAFENSNLPDAVNQDFVNNLLIKIRKEIYKI